MEQEWATLYKQLQSITSIPLEEWNVFKAIGTFQRIDKSKHFVIASETPESIGFCLNGLFRFYYTTLEGTEYNKSFCIKGEFVTSYSALLQQSPSPFSIQAITNSELIVFPYKSFKVLYERHPCWERLGRIIAEQLYIKKEKREHELLTLSAEERYKVFLQQFAEMANQIPQYQIASYLGITPVALSRIRKRLT
ncbi:Crp/Fnr family transcriptional regulator [Halalkalibacter hemicellulosilyticus]|uniref:cAMP-binding proteins-catabolite gene activator and regulatory subunit of cAMP-dependent protein kinases n=1 Tax=Halalkalibacter hemicellulosilyticusJCM 9152 TaxID=1236971 RepID=W4QE65_9BACI|nr:Crp/Fnr family transcriptional regulator [Halalkalibacter hemicellulosilyticus]GAE29654.1 cAMP-binding proteins - catabolite gene activator and regulatory subunit of cAMP-dependent protein kinases [Halalkalibacter hemicellulosilyticusJCM 9152]